MGVNKEIVLLKVCIFLIYNFTLSQPRNTNFEDQNLDQVFSDSGMYIIADKFYDNGWIRFREDLGLEPDLIFKNYKSLFGLSKYDEMVLEKIIEDKKGSKHYRFQQYHNGILVEGMKYTIHTRRNQAYSGSGSILVGLQSNSYQSQTSVSLNEVEEELRKEGYTVRKNMSSIITKLDEASINPSNYSLAYKLVNSTEDGALEWIYVDSNHRIVKTASSVAHYSYPTNSGTCETLYNGAQNFKTYYEPNFTCEDFYHMGLSTFDGGWDFHRLINYRAPGENPFGCYRRPGDDYRDTDNEWHGNDNTKMATSAFWALQKAYEYFEQKHQLTNFDLGSDVYMYVAPYTSPTPNLKFSVELHPINYNITHTRIEFSTAIDGISNPMVSPDVIGHEYAHGVLHFLDLGLNHTGETGAIEEGICDIFGSLIENHALGFSNDIYVLAEDPIISTSSNIYKRSLMNPKSMGLHSINANCDMATGMPDTYYGDNWELRSCNVNANYTNSSILGYWYYLLSNGGSGVNDNDLAYNVSGIGLETAAEILYEFMTAYLAPASNYTDVRNATIEIAYNNYDACSEEYVQTVKAWDAVGVPSDGPYSYEDKIIICHEVSSIHQQGLPYYNSAVNSVEINCTIGNGYHTTIESGGTIKLNPGFSYGTGGSLKLDIVPCD